MTHSASDNMLRAQVAACTLLLNNLKIMGYSGHVSARLPGRDAYLIQGFDQPRSGLRPEHLLICDFDGKMLSGPPGQRPPAEVYLHGEILRARPDINSVAHFHHDITNVFTLVEGGDLLPLKNHAVRWVSGIPVHDDPSHVANSEFAARWRRRSAASRDADPRARPDRDRGIGSALASWTRCISSRTARPCITPPPSARCAR